MCYPLFIFYSYKCYIFLYSIRTSTGGNMSQCLTVRLPHMLESLSLPQRLVWLVKGYGQSGRRPVAGGCWWCNSGDVSGTTRKISCSICNPSKPPLIKLYIRLKRKQGIHLDTYSLRYSEWKETRSQVFSFFFKLSVAHELFRSC